MKFTVVTENNYNEAIITGGQIKYDQIEIIKDEYSTELYVNNEKMPIEYIVEYLLRATVVKAEFYEPDVYKYLQNEGRTNEIPEPFTCTIRRQFDLPDENPLEYKLEVKALSEN